MKLKHLLLFICLCFTLSLKIYGQVSITDSMFSNNPPSGNSGSKPDLTGDQTRKPTNSEGQTTPTIFSAVEPQVPDNQKLTKEDAALIKEAMDKIHEKNPDQKGGWVAEVLDKGTLSEMSRKYPEFFDDKVRNGSGQTEVGRLVQFDENGNILSDNRYVRGNAHRYGEDNYEYMSMPYGKQNTVWKDSSGSSQIWKDTDGQWVNPDFITTRVGKYENYGKMSPGMTIERVHPISNSGTTNGCYGFLDARYGNGSNSQSMINFADSRVYLGKLNGYNKSYNQSLLGYRTARRATNKS